MWPHALAITCISSMDAEKKRDDSSVQMHLPGCLREPGHSKDRAHGPVLGTHVGSPASGKSSFVTHYFPSYTTINQDTLGSLPKCLKIARAALEKGESIISDNTNPTISCPANVTIY